MRWGFDSLSGHKSNIMPSLRVQKVNELIRDHLSEMFSRELSLKVGVLATIARVDTTGDLRYTRVSVSVFPEGESGYVRETLRRETGRLQKALHGKLYMKPLPRLSFVIDDTPVKADEVEKLLKKISEEHSE